MERIEINAKLYAEIYPLSDGDFAIDVFIRLMTDEKLFYASYGNGVIIKSYPFALGGLDQLQTLGVAMAWLQGEISLRSRKALLGEINSRLKVVQP